MIETMFQAWYLIESDTKYPKGHEFTTAFTNTDIDNAEKEIRELFNIRKWNATLLRIKDYKNDKVKTFIE